MSLENAKMGAKVRISNYAYYLEDKYKEDQFREILSYALCDIDDDNSLDEIKESVQEAIDKLIALEEICKKRIDAIMALRAYAEGLNVKASYLDRVIDRAIEELRECDGKSIIDIRDKYMEELRVKGERKGPKR